MSRESAGAAIRALRESRDWSLADLAAATGVSIMGLSYLERGARKPHKGTVQKVENGLGLPPGTYSRLLVAADPDAELGPADGRADTTADDRRDALRRSWWTGTATPKCSRDTPKLSSMPSNRSSIGCLRRHQTNMRRIFCL